MGDTGVQILLTWIHNVAVFEFFFEIGHGKEDSANQKCSPNKGTVKNNQYVIHDHFGTVREHYAMESMDDVGDREPTERQRRHHYIIIIPERQPLPTTTVRIRGTNNNFYLKRAAVPRVRVKTGRHAQQNRVVTPSPTTITMASRQLRYRTEEPVCRSLPDLVVDTS